MRTLSISFNSNILPCHLIVHKWGKLFTAGFL